MCVCVCVCVFVCVCVCGRGGVSGYGNKLLNLFPPSTTSIRVTREVQEDRGDIGLYINVNITYGSGVHLKNTEVVYYLSSS